MSASVTFIGWLKPAFVDHREGVAELQELIEVLADHHDGGPRCGQIDQRLVDARRAGIDAPCWLADHQHPRPLQDFAAHDVLLEVAARQRTGRSLRPRRLHGKG